MKSHPQLRKPRIALVQMQCDPSPPVNLERAASEIEKAAGQGASIVCLPELFLSHYFCQSEDITRFDLAEPIPGPTTERLAKVAKAKRVVIIASLFERRAEGLFHNTAVVIGESGSLAGIYRKMHIPDDPLYHEKFYFTPGDLGFRCFNTGPARVGVLVCWDQWFPEAARLTALRGAEILFYPTAIGWIPEEKAEFGAEQADAWETVQRGHAISNGVFLAAVNRVGREGGLEFWGRSFVADPMGCVIARAGGQEETLLVDCDLDRLAYVRRTWPFFRDRRIDAYVGIDRRLLDSPEER